MAFSVYEACVEAIAATRSNALRSGLAALATAASVATIVLVVGALDGIGRYARETSARAFGSDTFVVAQVSSGQLSRRELADRLSRNPPIRRADVRFLDRRGDGRVLYAPTAQQSGDVAGGSRTFEGAAINGTTSTMPDIRVIEIGDGRFFSAIETSAAAQVAVIGADVADALFPAVPAVGRRVRIAGRAFEVVGVVSRQGQAGGVSLDRYVYIPLPAFERAFGAGPTLQVFARAARGTDDSAAEGRAYASMRARRQLAPGDPDTFDVITPDAARTFVLRIAERIGAAAFPISFMALLAAVVVVTNTALVSVTQRMREIGIRRAIGAPQTQILLEVLAEAVLTALIGGVIGILAAALILAVAARALGVPLATTALTAAAAFGAAALTGLAAGYFPARRAARADVIAALRLE